MMKTLFLSYSTKDHYFADLAEIKLASAGIKLWRDSGSLRAGSEWRGSIESGISNCLAVLVALSESSSSSSYVTFEWAFALGRNKPIIPVMLTKCIVHPRLEPIQYLDFSHHGSLPWDSLIERVREIEGEGEPADSGATAKHVDAPVDPLVLSVLSYLDQRGFQMASFKRLRTKIENAGSDAEFEEVIRRNPTIFRRATIKGGLPGIAKL